MLPHHIFRTHAIFESVLIGHRKNQPYTNPVGSSTVLKKSVVFVIYANTVDGIFFCAIRIVRKKVVKRTTKPNRFLKHWERTVR